MTCRRYFPAYLLSGQNCDDRTQRLLFPTVGALPNTSKMGHLTRQTQLLRKNKASTPTLDKWDLREGH